MWKLSSKNSPCNFAQSRWRQQAEPENIKTSFACFYLSYICACVALNVHIKSWAQSAVEVYFAAFISRQFQLAHEQQSKWLMSFVLNKKKRALFTSWEAAFGQRKRGKASDKSFSSSFCLFSMSRPRVKPNSLAISAKKSEIKTCRKENENKNWTKTWGKEKMKNKSKKIKKFQVNGARSAYSFMKYTKKLVQRELECQRHETSPLLME